MSADHAGQRAERAALDLAACAAWAAPLGLHLVLERLTTEYFPLTADQLPAGTLDGRALDAVSIGRDDPGALVVTSGGIWWGDPVREDPAWDAFAARPGATWATLAVSRLSGGYLGLHVGGAHSERFTHGRRVVADHVEVEVGYDDGRTGSVTRTNVDFVADTPVGRVIAHDRSAAHAELHRGGTVVRADSSVHDADALARLLAGTDAGPSALSLNGQRWVRDRTYRPDSPAPPR